LSFCEPGYSNDDGVEIEADYFEYNKSTNILEAKGNVKVIDKIKKLL